VNGGVCRGKIISDLHFKSYFEKKNPADVASFGNCMRPLIVVLQKLKFVILLTS
jgi:hypothetical protein